MASHSDEEESVGWGGQKRAIGGEEPLLRRTVYRVCASAQ